MRVQSGFAHSAMQFGISTHLYHGTRLERDHLVEIAAHGFDAIELFATRTHFDYHDDTSIARLAAWLDETGLRLHSIHAPITTGMAGGVWGPAFSNATKAQDARRLAVRETEASLAVARRIPVSCLVVHLGVPRERAAPGDNDLDAARQSFEEIHEAAAPLGVRVAAEVIPNDLSTAAALVALLEDELDLGHAGVCLDYGHAFLMGDVVEAIEAVSGHLIATHVHDNRGLSDDHLVPFEGAIDWAAALIATQKVGYDGTLLLELAGAGSPRTVLENAQRARARFEQMLT